MTANQEERSKEYTSWSAQLQDSGKKICAPEKPATSFAKIRWQSVAFTRSCPFSHFFTSSLARKSIPSRLFRWYYKSDSVFLAVAGLQTSEAGRNFYSKNTDGCGVVVYVDSCTRRSSRVQRVTWAYVCSSTIQLDKNTIDIIRVHVYVYCKQLIIYAYFYFYVLYTYSTHKQIVLYFVCPFFKVFYVVYCSSPLRNSKKTSFLLPWKLLPYTCTTTVDSYDRYDNCWNDPSKRHD